MGAVRRRQFLIASGTASVVPLAGDQQAGRVHSVGILFRGAPIAPDPLRDAFRDALREFGWIEGENVVIEARYAEGVRSRLRSPSRRAATRRSNAAAQISGVDRNGWLPESRAARGTGRSWTRAA